MVAAVRQFDICANRGARSDRTPFLVVLQHAVGNPLQTRLAAPLIPVERRSSVMEKVEPLVDVAGVAYVAVVSQLRALPLSDFGEVVGSAETSYYALQGAIDFLINGY